MERRILGIKIPGILPNGEFSVFKRVLDPSASIEPEKGPSRQEKLQARIFEALDSYNAEGVNEQSAYGIVRRIEEIHPPKHWWNMIGTGTIINALWDLEEKGELIHRIDRDPKNVDDKGKPIRRYLYSRVPQEILDSAQR